MKQTNGRFIPNQVGEFTNQACINQLVSLLDECANAFSSTIDGDTLALTSLSVAGATTFTLGATDTITVDAGTTDHTGANVLTMDVDVNSANCKAINIDLDVGTALGSGEKAYGVYVDVAGISGDNAGAAIGALYATGNTTSGAPVTGLTLAGGWDTAVAISGTSTTALSITGAATTAIAITAAAAETALSIDAATTAHTGSSIITGDLHVNSAACIFINLDLDVSTALSSGEYVYGSYFDVDGAAGDNGNSGIVAYCATSANTSGGTTIAFDALGSWDYGLALAGACSTGISISGASTTAISITGNATTAISVATGTFAAGISLGGTMATGITINDVSTNGINFAGTTHVGINFVSATPTYGAYSTAATGGRNNPFVKIGSWDDPLTIVQTDDHWVPIQVNVKKSGDIAFDTAAARLRVDTNGAQPTSAVGCLQLRQNLAHNLASSAILNASVNVSAAVAVQTGSLLGGYFSIEGSGAVTKAGDNDITVLEAVCNNTGGGIDNVFLALMNGTGQHVDEIVKIAVTNGTADCGLRFEGLTDQIIVAGSSSTPLVCDDADVKFVQIYADCGASSGDNRGIYNRLYLTGTGGGESLRSYTDLSGTVGTAHGCHISLGFGESTSTGAVTGLGVAGRFTLGLANTAYPATGTLAVIQAEVYSFGADADPATNQIAILNIGNHGDAGGQADVDDDAVLMYLSGWTSADGNMVVKAGTPGASGNATWSVRVKTPDGNLAYLHLYANPCAA